jgi:hypothetical protein
VTSQRSAAAGLLGATFLFALAVAPAEAQERVRLFGTVQWIASSSMQMMTVSGTSVAVDLTQANQSSYQALRNGQPVVVDGVVSADRRGVIAREIWRDEGGAQGP